MSKALPNPSRSCWSKWILWGVYTLCIAFLASRHECWYDEYHVWFLSRFLSFKELFQSMTSEGHFLLWFLPVRVLSKAGCSFWCLQLLSVSLLSAAAWVLIMKAPLNLVAKGLIVFSFPFVYWFPVISRCYALIPVILFSLACLYREDKHPLLYAVLVGLLAHTHAYMEGAVAALFLLWCYERIWIPHKGKRPVRQGIIVAVIIILFVALAFLQVSGSLAYGQENLVGRYGLWQTLRVIGISYCPISVQVTDAIKTGRMNLLTYASLAFTIVLWLAAMSLLFKVFWRHKENRKFAFFLLVSVGWQFLMSVLVFEFAEHRPYLPLMLVVFALLCVYKDGIRRETLLILASLFIMTSGCNLMIKDIREPFCPDTAVYDAVKKNIPLHSQLFVISNPESEMAPYAKPSLMTSMFEFEYDASYIVPSPEEDYQEAVAQVFKRNQCRDAWCILAEGSPLPSNPWYTCVPVTEVAGCRLCHITSADDGVF